MREALKARHAVPVLLLVTLWGALTGTLGGVDVPVPFVSSLVHSALPFPVLTGVLLAVVLPGVARSAEPAGSGAFPRRPVTHTLGFLLLVWVIYSVAGAACAAALAPDSGTAPLIVADALCLLAFSTAARWVWPGPTTAVAPVVVVALVMLFGRDAAAGYRPWAWLLTRDWFRGQGATGATGLTVLLLLLSLTLVLAWTSRPLFGAAHQDPFVKVHRP